MRAEVVLFGEWDLNMMQVIQRSGDEDPIMKSIVLHNSYMPIKC